jgi:alpha-ketoglutarate-dependent taurine dioxygenase
MLETIDLTPRIGTEIRADRRTLLEGHCSAQLRDILEARGVLVFKRLALTEAEQLDFTRTLGTPKLQDGRDVLPVSLDPERHPGREYHAEYQKGSFYWHIDGSNEDVPSRANMLTAHQLAKSGGDTQFANTYAAWDDLPDEDKQAYQKLRVVHAIEASQRYFQPEPSLDELIGWRRFARKTHPLVWTHKSGRKSLVLGATAAYVEGMDYFDSSTLLTRLRDWVTRPQFVYAHKWDLGDLVIWDNTGTMHRATPYPVDSGRYMSRTVLEGEEALV